MGIISTLVNTAAEVGIKLLSEIVTPSKKALYTSKHPMMKSSNTGGYICVHKMGDIEWAIKNNKLNVYNSSNEMPFIINFSKNETVDDNVITESDYILLDPHCESDPSEFFSRYNNSNSIITVAPKEIIENNISNSIYKTSNSENRTLSKITFSSRNVRSNYQFEIKNGVQAIIENNNLGINKTTPSLIIYSQIKPKHFDISVQAIVNNEVIFTHGNIDNDTGSLTSLNLHIPFPEGTSFISDIVDNLLITITYDMDDEASILEGFKRGTKA